MSDHAAIAAPELGRSDHLDQHKRDNNPEQQGIPGGQEELQRGGVGPAAITATTPKFNLVQNLALVVTFAGLQLAWLAGFVYLAVRLEAAIAASF